MTPELWARVNELFESVLEMEEAERSEFLDRECKDNEELRSQVEALLDGEKAASANAFLDTNPINVKSQLPEQDSTDMIGESLGAGLDPVCGPGQ